MEKIIILDFGSQYTQLIARRVRELKVYSEVYPFYKNPDEVLKDPKIIGIILSGGPASVYAKNAPTIDPRWLECGLPILGICYGMQLMCQLLGGTVKPGGSSEYGRTSIDLLLHEDLFFGLNSHSWVWASHGDQVVEISKGFITTASSSTTPINAIANPEAKLYGLQFHPEVHHSIDGRQMLDNFVYRICQAKGDWHHSYFITHEIEKIKQTVGDQKVLCALSGGVDSSVVAALLHKAIPDQLVCMFVDTGLQRKNEGEEIYKVFKEHFQTELKMIDAQEIFLNRLAGVNDPEQKRKIIGGTFIEVFLNESKKYADCTYLAQGTLYPDVIESVSLQGPASMIKSHHNVGGLPKDLPFKLIEPLRELFKDEVRIIGRQLGLPDRMVDRHPFPGPGLGIRIIGAVDFEKLELLRQADYIFTEELRSSGLYNKIWQAGAILLPIQSVGVMGDERTYESTIALRAVTSVDGMTADWYPFEHSFLANLSNRLINEIKGVNRVVYDISSKPPATIEWE